MPLSLTDQLTLQLHPVARVPAVNLVARIADELGLVVVPDDAHRGMDAQRLAVVTGASMDDFGWHNITNQDGSPAALALHLQVKRQGPGNGLVGFGDLPLEYPTKFRAHVVPWWEDGSPGDLTPRQQVYMAMCNLAREEGWRVGGRWHRLQDWCHVEFHPPTLTPEEVQASLNSTGVLPAAFSGWRA